MNELVATIRAIMAEYEDGVPDEVCAAAADRIEALEAALREIASGYPSPADARLGRLMQIARAALDKEAGK
jgi:hypothetical protein